MEYSEETVHHAVKICKQLASFLNDADAYVKGQLMAREISEAALMQKSVGTLLLCSRLTQDSTIFLFPKPELLDIVQNCTSKIIYWLIVK